MVQELAVRHGEYSMDEERRIRFLVAPALFVASLLIGALSDPTGEGRRFIEKVLTDKELSNLLAGVVAGGGVVVFAGGYIFGTITVFILRVMFLLTSRLRLRRWKRFYGNRFHEVVLSNASFKRVRKRLGAPQVRKRLGAPGEKLDRLQELSAGAVFDFEVLRKDHEDVHRWLFRRWSAFNIAANSIIALGLSFPAGHFIGVRVNLTWGLSVVIFEFILWWVMFWAWNDTMDMLEFMTILERNKPWPQPIPAGERAKPQPPPST
jgi:hypothetical protein